jgi:hypothetical protein
MSDLQNKIAANELQKSIDSLITLGRMGFKDHGFAENKISDGYHTFAELYEFRMVLQALLFNTWAAYKKHDVHKSWKHFDGESCFGGGWFVVLAMTPYGQVTNHYKEEHWDLFKIPESPRAKYRYDGHSAKDCLDRYVSMITQTS